MRSPCCPWSRDFPDQGAGGGSALSSRRPAQSGVGHETRPETVGFSTIRPSLWFCPRNQALLTLSTRASQAARGVLLVLPRRRPGLRRARGEDRGPLSPAAPGGGGLPGKPQKVAPKSALLALPSPHRGRCDRSWREWVRWGPRGKREEAGKCAGDVDWTGGLTRRPGQRLGPDLGRCELLGGGGGVVLFYHQN